MSQLISLCHLFNVVKTYVKSHLTFLFAMISRYTFVQIFLEGLSLTLQKSFDVTGLYCEGYSEKATKFVKIFHLRFDATE